jgi:cysteinyl-tRNA synthetase
MNITDIDDKIIKRARQNHLYEQYLHENKANIGKVLRDVSQSIKLFDTKYQAEADSDKQKMMLDLVSSRTNF